MFGFFLRVTTPLASNDAVVSSVPFVVSRLPCLRWCLQVILVGPVCYFAVLAERFAFKHACPTLRSAKRLNKCAGSLPRLYLCRMVAFDVFDRSMPRGHVFSILHCSCFFRAQLVSPALLPHGFRSVLALVAVYVVAVFAVGPGTGCGDACALKLMTLEGLMFL